MRSVRDFEYDAVIGVGGIGDEAQSFGIAGRVTWMGIGPRKVRPKGSEAQPSGAALVTFEKFEIWDDKGPMLHGLAPHLARRLYEKKARYLLGGLSEIEQKEAMELLALIRRSPPSSHSLSKGQGNQCRPRTKPICLPRKRC